MKEVVELYPKSLLYNVDEVKKIITVKKSRASREQSIFLLSSMM
jgi:hypothetical protein